MSKDKEKSSPGEMTFFEHLDAFRPHLIRAVIAVAVFMVVAFLAREYIVDYMLFGPQSPGFPTNVWLSRLAGATGIDALRINQLSFNIVNTQLAGQLNMHIKISLIAAIVLAVPYLLFEVWQFVKPALTTLERRASRMFVFYVSLCFFTGLLFGYFIIVPLSINFLSSYQVSEYITNMIDIESYLSTVINVSLACAAVFQLPLLVYFLTRMGLLTPGFMRRYRRHAVVVLLIFSTIITPPDVFSQILVALPLYGLYEYSIHLSAKVQRKMQR